MLQLIARILITLLRLYQVLIVAQVVVQILRPAQKPWITLLSRACEPALRYSRALIARVTRGRAPRIDWSPIVAVIACWLLQVLVGLIFGV